MLNLVAFAGSASETSYNRKLINYISHTFNSNSVRITPLSIADVPLFNQDVALKQTPASVARLNDAIKASDGVIIATPEHNHTTTAALKSVLEWLSYQLHPFVDKPVWVVGASYYDQGTSRAQLVVRRVLEAPGVNALVMPGSEFLLANAKSAFSADGKLKDARTQAFLASCFERFCNWVKALRQLSTTINPATAADEDLAAQRYSKASIKDVAIDDPNWTKAAARSTHAAFGQDYVQLDYGVLTVEQLNAMLNALPQALTFIAENNQITYAKPASPTDAAAHRRTQNIRAGQSVATAYPNEYHPALKEIIHALRTQQHDHSQTILAQERGDYFVASDNRLAQDERGKYVGTVMNTSDYWQTVKTFLAATKQKVSQDYVVPGDENQAAFSNGTQPTTATPAADTTTSASVKPQSTNNADAPVMMAVNKGTVDTTADTTTSASVKPTAAKASPAQTSQPAKPASSPAADFKPSTDTHTKQLDLNVVLPSDTIF